MKHIPLTKGKFAVVDDEDYEVLSCYKWSASTGKGKKWYAVRMGDYKLILMHRQIMNPPKGLEVDHIDSDGLNNARNNLRVVTHRQNIMGKKKHKNTASKYRGVIWNKSRNRWNAQIKVNYKGIYLGSSKIQEEAAKMYDIASIKYFGIYGKTNFPKGDSNV